MQDLTPERWRQIEAIFAAAAQKPADERDAYVEAACAGDDELRREVQSLLAHDAANDQFLNELLDVPGVPGVPGVPDRVGAYRILGRLGEGGMGVVYLAQDERLHRNVALKVLRGDPSNPHAQRRLIREARTAAAISHPLICQVYELGEWQGQPFIAMELVEGQSLASRLADGALLSAEATRIALAIAEALGVLHGRGLIHRDLKPSNIFLTSTGVKLLDFGLTRSAHLPDASEGDPVSVTHAGTIVGTPQYSAPEQLTGDHVDTRADLFSLGVVLFEMLAGRPPFSGRTLAAVLHAVVHEAPPALTGSAAVVALDRVVYRALAKGPDQRYAHVEEFVADLRRAQALATGDERAEAREIQRLAVLPFRLLNPDREIDYLAMSFADALVSELSGFEALVVRSVLRSAKYTHGQLDLAVVAKDLAVDVLLTGSILRQRDRLRVSAELISVPQGDVMWTHVVTVPLGETFDAHEQFAQRVSASLPLTAADRARRSSHGAQPSRAFELYLRGMQLRMEASSWRQARTFFADSLALDPAFAAAWAERGRLDRILGKYEDAAEYRRAEVALARALELDPDHGAAQYYYAQLEIDLGRPGAALMRLLARARRHRAEPAVYAGIVHAARYGGLLEASEAADAQAKRLDPAVTTSVLHTYYMQGDYTRALAEGHRTSDPFEARVLGALGRESEAIAAARREEDRFAASPLLSSFSRALRAAFEGNVDEAIRVLQRFEASAFSDGEGLFYFASIYAKLARLDDAMALLDRAVQAGFVCAPAFQGDPYLAPLRAHRDWPSLMDRVFAGAQSMADEFIASGGPVVLGLPSTPDATRPEPASNRA